MFRNVFLAAALAATLAPSTSSANGVAKFNVIGSQINGTQVTVNIAWEYLSQGAGNGNGVKFYIHKSQPGYKSGSSGVAVGSVDMKDGNGTASFSFDLSQVPGAAAGQGLCLTGTWSNGHEWGTDAARPGGDFTVGSQNSRLRRRVCRPFGSKRRTFGRTQLRAPSLRLMPKVFPRARSMMRRLPAAQLRKPTRRLGR